MIKTRIVLFLAAAALVAGCASTPETRIADNPQIYSSLSASHRNLVSQGKIKEGMTKDAVLLAWGSPNSILEGGKGGKQVERWRFFGYYPVWTDTYCFGYGGYYRGYYGRQAYYAPAVDYIPYTQAEVEFSKGCVTSWQRLR